MKIMSRDFTTREKIMLLVLTLILLAAGYYAVIDQPIRTAINEAKSQQDELNTELMLLQTKAASLSRMQSELDSIEQSGSLGKMGSYNNSKAELDELNQLLQDANTYDISFSDVTRDGDLIRRSFSLTFSAPDYDKAADLVNRLCTGEWRCIVSDLRYVAAGDDLNTGSVNVGVTATFYETMQGGKADSGLPADASAAASRCGFCQRLLMRSQSGFCQWLLMSC